METTRSQLTVEQPPIKKKCWNLSKKISIGKDKEEATMGW